jgi:HK97 gp10 family phage protein
MIQFKLEGSENLRKNLKILQADLQLKTARAAGRKAANIIRDAAKSNAAQIDDPETANSIAENIVVQASAKDLKKTGDLVFRIGVRGGAKKKSTNNKNTGGDTFYWRFIELGTSRLAARPFLLPALRDNINRATTTFIQEFDKGISRATKRLKK